MSIEDSVVGEHSCRIWAPSGAASSKNCQKGTMLGPRVEVVIVLDFMCPWSFIGMQSFQLAQQALQERFTSNSPDGECGAAPLLSTRFIPYEFDLPGTYPPEGKDWTEYCQGYGPAKAEFLLKEKLPRAFGIGKVRAMWPHSLLPCMIPQT